MPIEIDWNKDDKSEDENIPQTSEAPEPAEKKSFLPKIEFKVENKPKEQEVKPSLKERKTKRSNKTKQLIVYFTIFVMIGGTIGFFGVSYVTGAATGEGNLPDRAFRVGDYIFYNLEDNTFGTLINNGGQEIPILFRLDPRYAEGIPIDGSSTSNLLASQRIYLTFNPNAEEVPKYVIAATEVARITALYGIETITAYTEDADPIDPNVPLITCDKANEAISVVKFELGKTGITSNGKCISVSGTTPDELILAADKLGYRLVGIQV